MDEAEVRARIYFAAVCRCFPGKTAAGGDRVPAPDEVRNCSSWMNDELDILRPQLLIAVGKLAISQFMVVDKLDQVIGHAFPMRRNRRAFDLIPLPHPSGASPWHRIAPGKQLLEKAMRLIDSHPAMSAIRNL
jgi:uracil-DNA glycosylase